MIRTTAIPIRPSDRPASELPDYEPTPADLVVIESQDEAKIEDRLSFANTLSAFEAAHRELLRLAERSATALIDLLDLTGRERVA